MISDIVKNSHRLIKNQIQQNSELYGEIIRIKNKKNNSTMFKQGNIFQEPDFNSLNAFKIVRITNFKYAVKNTNKQISNSHREYPYNQQQKSLQLKRNSIQNPQKLISISLEGQKDSKTIHSRNSNIFLSQNKPSFKSQIHKRSSLKNTNKLSQNFINSFVEEPGFMNLCFYKNSLQKISSARSPRVKHSSRQAKRSNLIEIQQVDKKRKKSFNRNDYNSSKHDCRPWSPIRQHEGSQLQISGNFKSLTLKAE